MIENDIVDDFGATDQNGRKVRLTDLLESGPQIRVRSVPAQRILEGLVVKHLSGVQLRALPRDLP